MLWSLLRSIVKESHASSPPKDVSREKIDRLSGIIRQAQSLPTIARVSEHVYLVRGRHGVFLANPHDQYVGAALIKYGEFSELESLFFSQIIRAGDCVVEVGANIGAHTVSLARQVGSQGHVIAIEPQPPIFRIMCANLALNSVTNVTTVQCGCGEKESVFYVPEIDYAPVGVTNFGGVSLAPELGTGRGAEVRVRSLDDVVGTRRVDVLKIDVEGMEEDIIKGAENLLRDSRPLLYVENDRVEKSRSLILQLQALDYRLFWHGPLLFNTANYFNDDENIYEGLASMNMFCVPRERAMTEGLEDIHEVVDPDWHPFAAHLN